MEETKYKIETTDRRELEMYINAPRAFYALNELREWRRELYRGKSYDWVVIYKGKKYKAEEWETKDFEVEENEEVHYVYDDDTIIQHIDEILRDIESVFDNLEN